MPNYAELDKLTKAQVQSIKLETKATARRAVRTEGTTKQVILAEGDSWFNFPPGVDLIDHLTHQHGFKIENAGCFGDTLQNMVYGEKDRNGTSSIDELVERARVLKPKVVLFSGGGNDVAGTELLAYLNHAKSGLPELRMRVVEDAFHATARQAIGDFVRQMTAASPGCMVIHHGYGVPVPNGAKTKAIWGLIPIAGPWIKTQFDKRRISFENARLHMRTLIDEFNKVQAQLEVEFAATGPNGAYKHVDLRGIVQDGDWSDELHLKPSAFAKCADVIAANIREVMPGAVMAATPAREGTQKAYWHRGTGKGALALPPSTKAAPTKASSAGKATKRVVKKAGKKQVAKKAK